MLSIQEVQYILTDNNHITYNLSIMFPDGCHYRQYFNLTKTTRQRSIKKFITSYKKFQSASLGYLADDDIDVESVFSTEHGQISITPMLGSFNMSLSFKLAEQMIESLKHLMTPYIGDTVRVSDDRSMYTIVDDDDELLGTVTCKFGPINEEDLELFRCEEIKRGTLRPTVEHMINIFRKQYLGETVYCVHLHNIEYTSEYVFTYPWCCPTHRTGQCDTHSESSTSITHMVGCECHIIAILD